MSIASLGPPTILPLPAVPNAAQAPRHPNNPLSADDRSVIQRTLNLLTEEALRHGLTITVEQDFEEFASLRKSVGDGGCYPAMDPKYSNIDEGFWVRVVNRDNALMAIIAERIYRCEDFTDLLRNARIWFDKGPTGLHPEYRVLPGVKSFGGVVAHAGGAWVHPSARRAGLSTFLPDYYRPIVLRRYAVDWHTALVLEPLVGHARKAYKYHDIDLIVDGYFPACTETYFPVKNSIARVYLCRTDRATLIDQLHAPTMSLSLTSPERQAQAVSGG
jgi:hypothetical protein